MVVGVVVVVAGSVVKTVESVVVVSFDLSSPQAVSVSAAKAKASTFFIGRGILLKNHLACKTIVPVAIPDADIYSPEYMHTLYITY